jgi:CheY-like chemotaxis protein/signal transduction histidine kinase
LVEDVIVAIISLVNINKFSVDYLETLEQSRVNLNTSYSNLIATERTSVLADHLSMINQELEAQSEELQDQAEELQDQTEELQRSSEELQEQNAKLEAQKIQVEAATKLKSEFLSNMSHELRTPLNSIMALSRVLIMQAKDKLNEDENNYLEIVERNGKRLLTLINDILDLSKIEAGKMEITPKYMNTSSFLQTIQENIQSLSEEKGLTLSLELPDNLPNLETDEIRLHHVILNIVSNAVKFTEEGSVEIAANFDSKNIYIKVKDTGIGINKETLTHIFDEFRQADGTSSRQYEGTGLGLAIAKKMIKILGGTIEVKSIFGKGTVFTVTVPIKWYEVNVPSNAITFENPSNTIIGKTILVVDDDPKTVKHISDHLREDGYHIISAISGKQALKLAEDYQPFAITLDIIMEDMDGWEVLQKLKSKATTKDIPVIVVSVSDDSETGFALGAVGFINKPIEKDLLLTTVRKINKIPDTVMIVDDNEFELKTISDIIESENIKTIKATNGKECIKLLESESPDILILDLMMPEMDGFTTLENIRKQSKTQNLPVIIVSAKDLTKEEKNKLSGKVSSIIAKSDSSPLLLVNEIKRIIKELEKSSGKNVPKRTDSKALILMVEDNKDAIIQVKAVLEKDDYHVDIAGGGQEALDYVKHSIPDGIILDLMMPEIDGFEVLEKIRSKESTKNIPILILTAKDLSKKDLARLSSNNIQQLIHKGDIDIKGLLLKVKQMLVNVPKLKVDTDSPSTKEYSKLQTLVEEKQKSSELNFKLESALPKVLIVEDNLDNMITINAILKGKYTITEAFNGEQGLALALSVNPDVILLDMSLPKMSGQKMIETLKTNSETKNIPLIAVTAQAMLGDKEKFIDAGCDGYVSKPIDQELLLVEISKFVGG